MRQRIHWPYIVAGYIALFCFGLLDNIRGPFFADLKSDLFLSESQASLYFAMASFMAFVGSQASERVVNRWSPVRGLQLGLLFLFIGVFFQGKVSSFAGLMLFSASQGIGMGIVMVFQHICVQEGATRLSRRQLLSGLHSMYGFSSLLGPLLAGAFLSRQLTWRSAYAFTAMIPALAMLAFFMVRRLAAQVRHHPLQPTSAPFFKLVYVGAIVGFYGVAELTISTRLVYFVRQTTEISASQATWYLSLFFVLLFLGRLVFTLLPLRRLSSVAIMKGCLLSSLLLNVLGIVHSPLWLGFCGLTLAPFFGVAMDFINQVFQEKAGSGITYAVSIMSVLVVPCHYLIGVVTEYASIFWAMGLGAISLTVSALLLFGFSYVYGLVNEDSVEV